MPREEKWMTNNYIYRELEFTYEIMCMECDVEMEIDWNDPVSREIWRCPNCLRKIEVYFPK